MDRCCFLELPPEVRCVIYRYYLEDIESQPLYLGLSHDRVYGNVSVLAKRLQRLTVDNNLCMKALKQSVNTRMGLPAITNGIRFVERKNQLSLLQVCKLVYKEASDVLYSNREFRAIIDYSGIRLLQQLSFPEEDAFLDYRAALARVKALHVIIEVPCRREARMLQLEGRAAPQPLAQFVQNQIKANTYHLLECVRRYCTSLQSVRLEMVWPDTRGIGFVPQTQTFLDGLAQGKDEIPFEGQELGLQITRVLSRFVDLPVQHVPMLSIATTATRLSHSYSLRPFWEAAKELA